MLDDRVIKVTFAISFIGHCLFLGASGFNPGPSQDAKKPEEITVNIEIEKPPLLPKINIMGEERKLKEVIEEPNPSEPEPEEALALEQMPKIGEHIEIINPDQEAILRYQDMIKQRIEEVRRYPSWAKRQEIEGTAYLRFTVLSNGLSRNIEIIHSSGSGILDQEAIVTINRANPFPPIPDEINVNSVQIDISIVFTLKPENRGGER